MKEKEGYQGEIHGITGGHVCGHRGPFTSSTVHKLITRIEDQTRQHRECVAPNELLAKGQHMRLFILVPLGHRGIQS